MAEGSTIRNYAMLCRAGIAGEGLLFLYAKFWLQEISQRTRLVEIGGKQEYFKGNHKTLLLPYVSAFVHL